MFFKLKPYSPSNARNLLSNSISFFQAGITFHRLKLGELFGQLLLKLTKFSQTRHVKLPSG